MSDVLPVVLMTAAAVAAAVVVIPRFKLPLQAEVGLAVCAAGMILVADSLWTDCPIGYMRPSLVALGTALIVLARRKRIAVRYREEPKHVNVYDLKIGGRGK